MPEVIIAKTMQEATRHSTGVRMDLIEPHYLRAIGAIMHVGAQKYGELNWKKGLSGEKGGINHAYQHLADYVADAPNDYGPREMHLAQVGANCMFEYHFERSRRLAAEEAEEQVAAKAEEKAREEETLVAKFNAMSAAEKRKFLRSIGK